MSMTITIPLASVDIVTGDSDPGQLPPYQLVGMGGYEEGGGGVGADAAAF